VYVCAEGEKTEFSYLDIIRGRATDTGVPAQADVHYANVNASGAEREPVKLVEAAVRKLREERRVAKRDGRPKKHWPQVWCLFDRDQHEDVDAAIRQGQGGGVGVAFSHPCFELWRLLHVQDVDTLDAFGGVCGLATQRLPFANSSPNIKIVRSGEIPDDSYAQAKRRAAKLNAAYGDHVQWSLRDPYTDVYEFVEKALGITSY
jgi:hypothetical protein